MLICRFFIGCPPQLRLTRFCGAILSAAPAGTMKAGSQCKRIQGRMKQCFISIFAFSPLALALLYCTAIKRSAKKKKGGQDKEDQDTDFVFNAGGKRRRNLEMDGVDLKDGDKGFCNCKKQIFTQWSKENLVTGNGTKE